MVIQDFLYIGAISFQVAGALLLIISFWGKTRKRIISSYYGGHSIAQLCENNYSVIHKKDVRICARQIYDNRASFIYIALGYGLGIWGNSYLSEKSIIAICVLFCAIILVLIEKGVVYIIAKIIYRGDMSVKPEELIGFVDAWI